MHGQARRAVGAIVGAAVLIGIGVWLAIDPIGEVYPELVAGATAAARAGAPVRVGPNVQVSAAAGAIDHMGCVLVADPRDASRLFIASTQGNYENIAGYSSSDGGATWTLACTRPHAPGEQVADEDLAFGPDGELYFVNMRVPKSTPGAHRYGEPGVGNIDLARSGDGGATWEERATVARYIDRPCLAVDGTSGAKGGGRGRVYVHANVEEPIVLVSGDGGTTLTEGGPLKPRVKSTRPSNPVVLADGSVLVTSAVFVTGSGAHLELPLWISRDAGATWGQVTPNLAGRWRHARIKSSSVFDVFYPRLAVDPGPGAFSGRLYCVWRDGPSSDESYILFSRSLDSGATWTTPVIVSEQPAGPDAAADYQADIPAVAVNKDGVVAVSWYDRRAMVKHTIGPGGVIPPVGGYNARLRVSRDGGATWDPSVQLNEKPMTGEMLEARYWTGLAAAADGKFHAAWIGDSTGTRQVWTATVTAGP
jgi:hypothetical protein